MEYCSCVNSKYINKFLLNSFPPTIPLFCFGWRENVQINLYEYMPALKVVLPRVTKEFFINNSCSLRGYPPPWFDLARLILGITGIIFWLFIFFISVIWLAYFSLSIFIKFCNFWLCFTLANSGSICWCKVSLKSFRF